MKVFYKLLVCRHAETTQNSKFVISSQYLQNEGRDEVDFLHADKHQPILQVDTINLGALDQAWSNYPE